MKYFRETPFFTTPKFSRRGNSRSFTRLLTLGMVCFFVEPSAAAWQEPEATCDSERRPASGVSQLRARGLLNDALETIDRELANDPGPCREVALRLERARVLDRIALHSQTLPATAALAEIDRAQEIQAATNRSTTVQAEIELGRAYYYYRAEMPDREFKQAEKAVTRAMQLARTAGASILLADATHQLGLIRAQQGKTATARELFDKSLELDRQGDEGNEDYMLAEYHRHIALTYILEEDWSAALPHYVASHQARLRSNAIDGSQFSALSLGDALLETDSPDAALPYFEYAFDVAGQMNSSYVKALSALRIADVLEKRGSRSEAKQHYSIAASEAAAVNRSSLVAAATSGLDRLKVAEPE